MKLNLTITMHQPVLVIMDELFVHRMDQSSVAITYAYIMAQEGNDAPWWKINAAIMERWRGKTALKRIKKMAWCHYRGWIERGQKAASGTEGK